MEAVSKPSVISWEFKRVTDQKPENSSYHCGVTNCTKKTKQSLVYYENESIISCHSFQMQKVTWMSYWKVLCKVISSLGMKGLHLVRSC